MRKMLMACAILLASPTVAQTVVAQTAVAQTAVAQTAVAQTAAPQPSAGYGSPIGMRDALALTERGIELATAQGLKLAIAVVEPTGELVAFARMDDVAYGAVTLAQQKARTAARFRMTTANGEEQVQNGRMPLLSAEDFVTIGGGVPVVVNGRIVGALGVSGASAKEDAAIASLIVAPR